MAGHVTKQKVAGPVPCDSCDLQRVCELLNLADHGLPSGRMRIVEKGGAVYRAGDRATHLITARHGMLRSVMRDGDRRQLIAVHIPGEALAVSAIETGTMAADIVAVTPTIYCSLPISAFTPQNYARVPQLAAAVCELQDSERARKPATVKGTLSKRVDAFFTDISRRLAARGMDSEGLEFDVPRQELGHHFNRKLEALQRALVEADDFGAFNLRENKIKLRRSVAHVDLDTPQGAKGN